MNENELRNFKSQIKYYFAEVYLKTESEGISYVLELENRVDFLLDILQKDARRKKVLQIKNAKTPD